MAEPIFAVGPYFLIRLYSGGDYNTWQLLDRLVL